ncbi:MAG: hypothetical protein J7M34_14580 [Anaerolineae bacterium]|nr:hypothetical protein [Anaerolineae bacterium]
MGNPPAQAGNSSAVSAQTGPKRLVEPVVPTPSAGVASSGASANMPLGVAFGEGSDPDRLDHFMDYIHDLGLHRTKVSFYWADLEPEPDQFDFQRLDLYLDQLGPDDQALVNLFTNGWCTYDEEVGSRKGAPLRKCPRGETSCKKSCDDYYTEFVTKVAERVRDRAHGGVRYFQRDTEPASGRHFPAKNPGEYCRIQHLFYQAVKSVLPDVLVVGVSHNGNFSQHGMGDPNSVEFFDYVLEHGKDDFDLLDVRLYEDIYAIPHRVKWFRDRMKRYGYEKPIVSTEHGGPDPRTMHDGDAYLFAELVRRIRRDCPQDMETFPRCANRWVYEHQDAVPAKLRPFFRLGTTEENDFNEVIHCHDITQRNLVMLASGVQATWWWNLQSPGKDPIFGHMRLRTPDMEELPGYACYKRLVQHMDGVTSVSQIDLGDPSIYFFEVKKSDGSSTFVAWHREGSLDPYDSAKADPVDVSLPVPFTEARVTDVFGEERVVPVSEGRMDIALSDKPIFIEAEGRISIPKPVVTPRPVPQPSPTPGSSGKTEEPQVGVNFIRFYFYETAPFQPETIFSDFSDLGVQLYRHLVKADLTWRNIEPNDGEWHFETADTVIMHSPTELIATVFDYRYASGTPPWCTDSANFQKTLGPEARDYLEHVVDRYGPYVKYWEIGNEMDHWRAADPGSDRAPRLPQCVPAGGFTPQEQGRFLAQVAQFIREHDPDAVIVMPGMGGLDDYAINTWFAGVLEGGGTDWFDVVNYHYYSSWVKYPMLRARLAKFLQARGIADKPVWMTETGSTSSPTLTIRTNYPNSQESQAADVFRRLVQAWGAGDQLVIWHSYIGSADRPNNDWREYGLREADGSDKLALYSYRLLAHELIPFRQITTVSAEPRGPNVYRVKTKDGAIRYVAWGSGSFTVPEGISKMTSVVPDSSGNFSWVNVTPGQKITLGESPVLLK